MDRLARAADAAVETAFRCYAGCVPRSRNQEALDVLGEELALAAGVTRAAAAAAIDSAIRRRTEHAA